MTGVRGVRWARLGAPLLTTAIVAAALPGLAVPAGATPAVAGGPVDLATDVAAVVIGSARDDDSGRSVAPAGDVNGDGFDDLVIGARQTSPGAPARFVAGSAFVVYGSAAGLPASTDLADLGPRGFRIDGAAANHQLGFDVAGAGDVNADGVDDIVVGAQGVDSFAGAAYVIYGRATADPGDVDVLTLGARGFAITAVGAGALGGAVDGAGDVNGDGIADVIVGQRFSDPGAPIRDGAGAAYVVYGRAEADPGDVSTAALGGRGLAVIGAFGGDQAGTSVAGVGDVNGDGRDDVAVGAPGADPANLAVSDAGTAYILFGQSAADPADVDLRTADARTWRITGATPAESVGESVAAAGDVNGDGRPDIVIGADQAAVGSPTRLFAGAALVVYGVTEADPTDLVSPFLGTRGMRIDGAVANERWGTSVAGAGDVNGDGVDDVVLGASEADPGTPARDRAGRAFVVFGQASADLPDVDLLAAGDRGLGIDGAAAGDQAGTGVSGVGDVTGDGVDDVAVGANRASPGDPVRANAGATFVVAGFGPPSPPRDPVATPEVAGAVVGWAAPAFQRGSPVVAYAATVAGPPGDPGTGTGCASTATPPDAPALGCRLSGLTPGVSYTVSVTATNATGRSTPSVASAPFVPLAPAVPLAPPSTDGVIAPPPTSAPVAPSAARPAKVTGVSARARSRVVLITWRAAAGSVSGYTVQQRRASAKGWREAGSTGPTVTRLVWRKARPATRYVVRVSATSAFGRGPWSAPVRVRTR